MKATDVFPPEVPQIGDKVLVTVGDNPEAPLAHFEGIVAFRENCPAVLRQYIHLASQRQNMAIWYDGEGWKYSSGSDSYVPTTVVVTGNLLEH